MQYSKNPCCCLFSKLCFLKIYTIDCHSFWLENEWMHGPSCGWKQPILSRMEYPECVKDCSTGTDCPSLGKRDELWSFQSCQSLS
jgi:hypothetical protein